ncbi:glycosyltransferase [Pseudactinotalea sp. HY160]|uniref:glycosyltransferase n=1 Tax=Pseudactinotalea sp. HY160 TaxID=2654490 RepID=UPI001311B790|nr:glycosyltransferase [Pseudactinotalea sp. HY160]
MVSIVIPAHDEERVLARLLDALGGGEVPGVEIVVVANGCTDRTADVARRYPVVLVETPVPSKIRALALGDARASSFPRLYVDGDVVLGIADVRALCGALGGEVHAAGPTRFVPMTGASLPVRWYYDVWQRLDGTRAELYGRGVLAVDRAGHERVSPWREAMSDDLMIAMSFAPAERRVVPGATVVIMPPRTYRNLLRRRVRAMTGNRQLAHDGGAHLRRPAPPGPALRRLAAAEPRLIPRIALFLATAAIAKARGVVAARRSGQTWLRDDSRS